MQKQRKSLTLQLCIQQPPSLQAAGRQVPITEARPQREVGEHDGGTGGGAAQVHERLASRLALLPPLLSPHELKVPPLGLLLVPLPSPPRCLHRSGEEPQRAGPLSVDRSAIGILDIETVVSI